MPKKELMTWEGSPQYRWKKMYRGTMYRVTCDDLRTGRTKEQSVDAANNWWEQKIAELTIKTIDPDKQEALDDIGQKISWATNNDPQLLPRLKEAKKEIEQNTPDQIIFDDAATISKNIDAAKLLGIEIPPDLDPIIMQHIFGDKRLWGERFSKSKKIDKDKTLSIQLEKFLEVQKLRLEPQSYGELSKYLNKVVDYLGKDLDASTINEQTIEQHWKWLASTNEKYTGKNKKLGFFRRFVTDLAEKRICPLPLNLKSKLHRFKGSAPAIYNEDLDGLFDRLRNDLNKLNDRFKLWALLGLNCGMTQDDWGNLTWEQINFKKGTLTRKRVKLKDQPNAPTVTYKLWHETIDLLLPLRKETGLVFTTKTGKPMYDPQYREGKDGTKVVQKDLFSDYWRDVKTEFTPAQFRSLGSTLLKKDSKYRQFATVYLANVPTTITDIHYSQEWEKPFFEALDFLHKEIFPI